MLHMTSHIHILNHLSVRNVGVALNAALLGIRNWHAAMAEVFQILNACSSNDCHIFQSNLRSFNSEYSIQKSKVYAAKYCRIPFYHEHHWISAWFLVNVISSSKKPRFFQPMEVFCCQNIGAEVTGFLKWLGPAWMIAMPLFLDNKDILYWRFRQPPTLRAACPNLLEEQAW